MVQDWMWSSDGETTCPGCGACYAVETARTKRRRYDYFRCEVCDLVVDEWIDHWTKRHRRIEVSSAAMAARPALLATAAR